MLRYRVQSYVAKTLPYDPTVKPGAYVFFLKLFMANQWTISPANVQSPHCLCCTCPVRIPCLMPISSHKTYFSAHVQSVCHTYFQSLVNAPYIMSISRQNATSTAHVQSVHHLSCQSSIGTSSIFVISLKHAYVLSQCPLPMPSPNTTSTSHVKSVHSSVQVQLVHHFSYLGPARRLHACEVSTLSLLPSSFQNTTFSADVQMVHPLLIMASRDTTSPVSSLSLLPT